MNIEECPVCGSPYIEWITPYEDLEDGEYLECCTCGWKFDFRKAIEKVKREHEPTK